MIEILRHMRAGARILDVGALTGSFPASTCPDALVVRVDLTHPSSCDGFVQGDAAHLPFPDLCFDAVIANHSLEHIEGFAEALKEIGRVVVPEGSLYIAVPNASTFSDRLFRWIYSSESGHINAFDSAGKLAADISRLTGLKLIASRDLHSSFEYLNRYYFGPKTSWRLWVTGNGRRWSIILLSYATRLCDRMFHTNLSAYGWALYFGHIGEEVPSASWSNVCVGCGAGHAADWLLAMNVVHRRFGLPSYRCPSCGAFNFFTRDQ